jgi:nucleotide-binding universal stress UspA family protein
MAYRAILVPLDGSAFAESALPLATGLAERTGAALQLVYVTASGLEEREMREYLEGVRERVAHRVPGGVQVTTLTGPVGVAVSEQVAAEGVDVVVLATHGRGGVSRAWLGSVAESLVATLTVPVLLVRPPTGPDAAPLAWAPPRRIIVPVDRSEGALAVLPEAARLARAVGAELLLTMVIAPLDVRAETVSRIRFTVSPEEAAEQQAAAREFLEAHVELLDREGVRARAEVLTHVHPATAILEAAAEADAEVIAMATHARRGVSRVVFGSVTDKVVRGTTRTMLLLRPAEPAPAHGD